MYDSALSQELQQTVNSEVKQEVKQEEKQVGFYPIRPAVTMVTFSSATA
jgi:hypothetical protein